MTCEKIVISDRAYNSIVTETFHRISTETGGIFLGGIVDSTWYIIEIVDPGPRSIFSYGHFEYDLDHVNYLAKVIARQYKNGLIVLGLWHRHPGSLDRFSRADDLTNQRFAELNSKGAISALVNLDPNLRFTFYHFNSDLTYAKTPFVIGDSFIPKHLSTFSYLPGSENSAVNPKSVGSNDNKIARPSWLRKIFQSKRIDKSRFSNKQIEAPNNYKADGIKTPSVAHEEYLLDLYAGEEYDLERILGLKYESTVTEISIKYEINQFLNGKTIQPSISFIVSFDENAPLFFSDGNQCLFTKGVFVRYAQSKLASETFKG